LPIDKISLLFSKVNLFGTKLKFLAEACFYSNKMNFHHENVRIIWEIAGCSNAGSTFR